MPGLLLSSRTLRQNNGLNGTRNRGIDLMLNLLKVSNVLIIICFTYPLSVVAAENADSVFASGDWVGAADAHAARTAFPCEHDELFSEFDFWAGSWDVHVADGAFAGSNVIEKSQHGCVLIENWSSVGGGTGTSINYVDKITGEWVQVWNDASGSQINIRGGMTDDGMLLSGTIHYVANGTTAPFRGLWTPLPDGRVRQFFEQSSDDGTTWTPWFEGFYTREQAD